MTYTREMAEACYEGLKVRDGAGRVPHIETVIVSVIERCAQAADPVFDDGSHPCQENLKAAAARIRALAAPPAGVGAEPEPECQSCQHPAARHTPECDCGCWGFFRKGARRCENPRCEGTGCAGNRGTDHGPNDVGAPAGTGGRR